MSRRILSFVLVSVLLVTLVGVIPVGAADGDFTIENGVLTKYNGTEIDVVIPNGVTSIGNRAFFGHTRLGSLTIPEGVTSIGDEAFLDCWFMQKLTIPRSVTSIGHHAFGFTYHIDIGSYAKTATTIYGYPGTAAEAYANEYGFEFISLEVPAVPFSDISEDAYYYDAVIWAVKNGITKGTSKTSFSPNDYCTRAQIVTFLYRFSNMSCNKTPSQFTDIQPTDYFYEAVLWALDSGITQGKTNTEFAPNDRCTRAEAVTFLYRYDKSPDISAANQFDDVQSNAYYAKAVAWASSNGITFGTSDAAFSPNNDCTRAQIVTFLYRYAKYLGQDVGDATPPEPSVEPSPEPSPSPAPETSWKVGDIVTMGTYEQDLSEDTLEPNGPDPIEWVVLDVQDGKALLITKDLLMHMPAGYDRSAIACWETSETRARLNTDFYNTAFSGAEKSRILNTTVTATPFEVMYNWLPDEPVYPDPGLTGANGFEEDLAKFNAKYARDTEDRLFLLSKDEVIQYFVNNPATKQYMSAYRTSYCAQGLAFGGAVSRVLSWALRTPDGCPNLLYYVDDWGKLKNRPVLMLSELNYVSIRPAMWVTLP